MQSQFPAACSGFSQWWGLAGGGAPAAPWSQGCSGRGTSCSNLNESHAAGVGSG